VLEVEVPGDPVPGDPVPGDPVPGDPVPGDAALDVPDGVPALALGPAVEEDADVGVSAAPVPLLPPWVVQAAAQSSAMNSASGAKALLMMSPSVFGRGWSGSRSGHCRSLSAARFRRRPG
jgi:hypothetical protein